MKQTNTRAMVETAFVSAIGVVLTAISVYLPIFGFLSLSYRILCLVLMYQL